MTATTRRPTAHPCWVAIGSSRVPYMGTVARTRTASRYWTEKTLGGSGLRIIRATLMLDPPKRKPARKP